MAEVRRRRGAELEDEVKGENVTWTEEIFTLKQPSPFGLKCDSPRLI